MTVNICFKEGKRNPDDRFSLHQQSVISHTSSLWNKEGDKLGKELWETHLSQLLISDQPEVLTQTSSDPDGCFFLGFVPKKPAYFADTVETTKTDDFHPKNKED